MLTIDGMPSRMKKDKKSGDSENQYDAYIFAIEIIVTVFLLIVIYLVYNLT